ncbi:glycosyltransferase family 2 protein [Micromonospora sp. NPDC050397]|uniref:glycosyltransferase family 2 protein n=1 Tax=Micromonospora sp. NPDC050397 TaxID=3364279 RepID=UPI00384E4C95
MTRYPQDQAARPGTGAAGATTGAPATAIIVTHNSARELARALDPLLRAGLAVRVVDNASTDGTPAIVARDFPAVHLTVNEVNVGFARAVNQAFTGVGTDVVLLVNPDCEVPAETAYELVGLLRRRPEVGIAGPRLLGRDGRVAISAHPFESLTSVLASRFGGALVPVALRRLVSGRRRRDAYDACRRPAAPVPVDWLSGACLAVRASVLRDIGGLDEGYFLYYEDEELCLQAWRRGAEVVYLPTVRATHVGGASSADPSWIWPHLYRSLLRFFARHRPRSYPLVRVAVLLRAVLGIGLAGIRLGMRPRAAATRARAWTGVARIALTADPERLRATADPVLPPATADPERPHATTVADRPHTTTVPERVTATPELLERRPPCTS